MRIARPVGLSQDGRSLLVATPSGEELAIPVDDRLHAALRGDRPRLGQLEIEMDNALGPRDIQARIRSGQSLEEVGRVAGLPLDRVERFAAPVLAEREHVALVALSSSVRRRGEGSGHRTLRLAVSERLQQRGVDADSVDWDAFRREDGRWTVLARYQSGEAHRQALFLFDLQGRFCLADDDEARWLLGEQTAVKGPQPGRRRPTPGDDDADTEPTLDLSDELALVRAIQRPEDFATLDPVQVPGAGDATSTSGDRIAAPRVLYPVPDQSSEPALRGPEPDDQRTEPTPQDEPDGEQPAEREAAEIEAEAATLHGGGASSPLDDLAGTFSAADEDAQAAYGGLSDASAVPETDTSAWEPGIVVDYPVEPSPEPPADEAEDQQPAQATDQQMAEPPVTEAENAPRPPPPAPGKRKRAAVPSWDEIMFGGPPRSG